MATRPTKKRKQVCSGLSSMDVCIVRNMMKHWKLFDIDYYQMNYIRGQFYFCNGEQSVKHGQLCQTCYNAVNCTEFQEAYKLYCDPFIRCICQFLNESHAKLKRNFCTIKRNQEQGKGTHVGQQR
eukprot:999470_1